MHRGTGRRLRTDKMICFKKGGKEGLRKKRGRRLQEEDEGDEERKSMIRP